jgi:hypothetical protein
MPPDHSHFPSPSLGLSTDLYIETKPGHREVWKFENVNIRIILIKYFIYTLSFNSSCLEPHFTAPWDTQNMSPVQNMSRSFGVKYLFNSAQWYSNI